MIDSGRTELSVSNPPCSFRLNWNWESKFKGMTIIFKSKQHFHKNLKNKPKELERNFSYVMTPLSSKPTN